jgi:hypothetical protein
VLIMKCCVLTITAYNTNLFFSYDRLCAIVVRVLGYRFRGPDSIPGATRFSEM